ncbi:MAG: 2-oxoacid:acceptor oxidoreductase family protein, partial [Chloroflexi bacterium]|nr:2-oxoacid:acceptor oxidoreductase family protein [Chloroflexota bacterium]
QRTAYYCSGCPHNRSTVIPEGSIVAAGIGCHSMALWMDPDIYGDIVGITQMGGEGAQWVGAAPFTDTKHIFQNIGDGTLFHSGGLALNFAVASGANITYKILYNSAVAMTGGQDAVGTLPIPALTRRLEAEGVKRIIITTDDADRYRGVPLAAIAEVRHRDGIVAAQEELAATPGVTVLIHDQQCAAEKRRLRKRGKLADPTTRVFINERVCEGCGDCGRKSNCLSVQPVETEFGRKTQIHQSSCNKDYSCLLGDCPSFVTVEPAMKGGWGRPLGISRLSAFTSRLGNRGDRAAGTQRADRASLVPPQPPSPIPYPPTRVPTGAFSVHMMGIGGTGVVTVSQILGTAALLDGRQVWGLDQTGLSQKGGPVVSDVKISALPDVAPADAISATDEVQDAVSSLNGHNVEGASVGTRGTRTEQTAKVTAGGADLYLGFDLLVAAGRDNLVKADAARTVAVVSTSQIPTGQMVVNTSARFPRLADVTSAIDAVTRADCNVYFDAQALSAALFGDHMPANLLLLGAAYQVGALPLSDAAIERAIRLNGAAVETSLAAFRWGRAVVADPTYVEQVVRPATASDAGAPKASDGARRLIASVGAEGELRRLLDVRVPDLIAYQNGAYARTYVEFVRRVREVEQARILGSTAITEAVARNLYKLMAYKDEYEVARLHLDAAEQAKLASQFDGDVEVTWNLHPPMLRALGLRQKIKLGPWFRPAMQALRDAKRVRGTPLDPFGYAEVRRVERGLIGEYRRMVVAALRKLSRANHDSVIAIAELPDMVRGYEQIKLENVRRYRDKVRELMARL